MEKTLKIFATKDSEKELYFQIEKTNEGLQVIGEIAYELFGEKGYRFENKWQTGLPNSEDYESYSNDKTFMGVVLSEKRIHIILKGINNKDKIKEIINRKYHFAK